MRYVIVDLEATCWERQPPFPHETIEFGAVCWSADQGTHAEFQTFVRPLLCADLSPFCQELTHIQQSDVDGAPDFPTALQRFNEWVASHEPCRLASWGAYDYQQLQQDAARHHIEYARPPHLNLKLAFARLHACRPGGMKGALARIGAPLDGTHHRALDDARNIRRVLEWMVKTGPVELE
jgi:inhibitor of KinA sporulation pathway (predicted exonuclease)